MKILIIGDDPKITGGVANYTRPLFERFSANYQCDYLYTTSYFKDYSLFRKTKIIQDEGGCYKLQNSEVLYKAKESLINDFKETKNDTVIINFIEINKYDVVHIHSMLGLSTSIYSKIKKLGVKLFVTVHEYWWLCPRQVMIDYEGNNCEGPQDLTKCASCALSGLDAAPIRIIKLKSTLKKDFPMLLNIGVRLKRLRCNKTKAASSLSVRSTQQTFEFQIINRLSHNIEALNKIDKVICVSSDVKQHLIKYGVRSEKLLVQHIGSLVADYQIPKKKRDMNPIRIGYIGGITYYKGVHLLVDAFLKLPGDILDNVELHLYGSYHESYMDKMREAIRNYPEHSERIYIHGRYPFQNLPIILESLTINVLPSLCADTAPQTIFESYSKRIPVIGPDIGGFKDFIIDGINGRLFRAGDSESLKKCLEGLILNPSEIDVFSQNIPALKTLDENILELTGLYSYD